MLGTKIMRNADDYRIQTDMRHSRAAHLTLMSPVAPRRGVHWMRLLAGILLLKGNTMTKTERSGGHLARRFVIEVGKMLRKHKAGVDVVAELEAARRDLIGSNPDEHELHRAFDAFCDCITERMDQ